MAIIQVVEKNEHGKIVKLGGTFDSESEEGKEAMKGEYRIVEGKEPTEFAPPKAASKNIDKTTSKGKVNVRDNNE